MTLLNQTGIFLTRQVKWFEHVPSSPAGSLCDAEVGQSDCLGAKRV